MTPDLVSYCWRLNPTSSRTDWAASTRQPADRLAGRPAGRTDGCFTVPHRRRIGFFRPIITICRPAAPPVGSRRHRTSSWRSRRRLFNRTIRHETSSQADGRRAGGSEGNTDTSSSARWEKTTNLSFGSAYNVTIKGFDGARSCSVSRWVCIGVSGPRRTSFNADRLNFVPFPSKSEPVPHSFGIVICT